MWLPWVWPLLDYVQPSLEIWSKAMCWRIVSELYSSGWYYLAYVSTVKWPGMVVPTFVNVSNSFVWFIKMFMKINKWIYYMKIGMTPLSLLHYGTDCWEIVSTYQSSMCFKLFFSRHSSISSFFQPLTGFVFSWDGRIVLVTGATCFWMPSTLSRSGT